MYPSECSMSAPDIHTMILNAGVRSSGKASHVHTMKALPSSESVACA